MNTPATQTDNAAPVHEATLDQLGVDQNTLPNGFKPMYAAMDECGTWYIFANPVEYHEGIWRTFENRIDQLVELNYDTNDCRYFPEVSAEGSLIKIVTAH